MTNSITAIEIVPYDPAWPDRFEELREALAGKLNALAVRIEHVGSTAVPGLAAKPILDVNIVIATAVELLRCIAALQELGYEHQGDLGIPGREAFRNGSRDIPRDGSGKDWPAHHLYACLQDNNELRRHLAFRDYLRRHPEQAGAYSTLKSELAERYVFDKAYSEAKSEFVLSVLAAMDPTLI